MNGDLLAAIILLGAGNVSWPVLFAFRRVAFTAWPAKSTVSSAAAGTGPAAAEAPLSPSGSGI